MSERRERKSKLPKLLFKFSSSIVALAVMLFFGTMAIKFCMGLFMTGDYIVTFPGADSPVLYRTENASPVNTALNNTNTVHSAQATITVAGDLMMHMPTVDSGKTDDGYNYDSIFTHVTSYVSAADYAIANLETTLSGTDGGNEYTGYPNFNAPDAVADAAKTAGFDMLLTGNEHCNDYGTFGLKRTLDILSSRGLDALGTVGTTADKKYLVKDIGGIQVGFVSYTYADIGDNRDQPTVNENQLDSNAAGLLNAFDYDNLDLFYSEMTTHIADMKTDGAEAIVLLIHWGDELSAAVSSDQTAIAQKMCDLGVDVIAGSHPHVVQEVALLTSTADAEHQTFCAYSLGNFLSNQRADNISLTTGQSEDGVLLNFTFARYSDGSVYLDSVGMTYTWVLIRGEGDDRTYHILPLADNVDWKTVYSLDDDQLADAKASHERTDAAVSESLGSVVTVLQEAKTARDTAYTEAAVG